LLKVCLEISSLFLPLLQCAYSTPPPLLHVFFLFLVYYSIWFFVGGAGGQSAQGATLVYPRGGWRNTSWCLVFTCWSAKCLPSRFGASVWQRGSPPVLSVMWHGKALYRLGVQGVEVLILLGALFPCSSISERVLIYRTHAVCFCTLVAILDPSWILNSYLPLNILHYF
jgi:hypothetical protein